METQTQASSDFSEETNQQPGEIFYYDADEEEGNEYHVRTAE